jgi:hypothetical protein
MQRITRRSILAAAPRAAALAAIPASPTPRSRSAIPAPTAGRPHPTTRPSPGITINTSPTDFAPIKQMRMARFDGRHWQFFGPLISGQAPA